MRITRAEVSGFGALRDAVLTFPRDASIVLLYGRNEAGKSTLMQFIRAMLFGFASRSQPHLRFEPWQGGAHGGALELALDDGRTVRVERYDAPGPDGRRPSAGTVRVTGDDGFSGGEEMLRKIIGEITSDVYSNVFAFGLSELEEVRTLHSDEISGYLYRSGYGVSAAAVMEAEKRIAQEMERLFKPRGKRQLLNVLAERLDEVNMRLRQSRGDADKYHDMLAQLSEYEERIEEYVRRMEQLKERSVWIETCLKAQEPWLMLCAAEAEWRRLPDVAAIPEYAFRQFEEEKIKLDQLLIAERQSSERLAALSREIASCRPNEQLLDKRREIAELQEQSTVIRSLEEERQEAVRELSRIQEQIRGQLARIDERWTEDHVRRVKLSLSERAEIARHKERMAEAERKLASVGQELARVREERKRVEKRRDETARHAEQAKNGLPPHFAGELARLRPEERRKQLQTLSRALERWRMAEAEVGLAERQLDAERKRNKRQNAAVFTMIACAVAASGYLLTEGWYIPAAVIGIALLLPAIVSYARGRRQADDAARSLAETKRERDRRAAEAGDLLARLAPSRSAAASAAGRLGADGGREPFRSSADGYAVLDELEAALDQLQTAESDIRSFELAVADLDREAEQLRGLCAELEERQEVCERELEMTGARWRAWLEEKQLPADVTPDTALELLNLIERVKEFMRVRDAAAERIETYTVRIETFERNVRLLHESLGEASDRRTASPHELIRLLAERLARETELAERKRSLEGQYADRLPEHREIAEQIRQVKERIGRLWAEAGAADEAQYREMVSIGERRRQLEAQMEAAHSRLAWLVTPAHVEKLKSALGQCGAADLEKELAELKEHLREAGEQLSRMRDERAKLEIELERLKESAAYADLAQERENVLTELRKHAEQYIVYAMADGLLRRTRELYERERQPEVLRQASRHLSTITDGAYVRVMAPYGEQKLIVERADGRQLETPMLSRGTVEQLYLAMRFALAEAFCTARETLPVVLDDIFVNFDEQRAAHCLKVVGEVARRHQVLMFTCHDYMRRLVGEHLPHARIIDLDVL